MRAKDHYDPDGVFRDTFCDKYRAILAALTAQAEARPDIALLAHHADAAADTEAAVRFGAEAASRAAELCAHREAVQQYRRVLRNADRLPEPLPDRRRGNWNCSACSRTSATSPTSSTTPWRRGTRRWLSGRRSRTPSASATPTGGCPGSTISPATPTWPSTMPGAPWTRWRGSTRSSPRWRTATWLSYACSAPTSSVPAGRAAGRWRFSGGCLRARSGNKPRCTPSTTSAPRRRSRVTPSPGGACWSRALNVRGTPASRSTPPARTATSPPSRSGSTGATTRRLPSTPGSSTAATGTSTPGRCTCAGSRPSCFSTAATP